MTNQSKWLISAYAIFFCGGVLVPLDYKLTPAEQLKLLAHSKAEFLVVEYHLWRAHHAGGDFKARRARVVLVTEAPQGADLARSEALGRISREARAEPVSCRARAKMRRASSIPRAPAVARKAAC